ncbi:MAG: DNA (cytosine-5-)-methyltransferase [Acidobacteriota bacterium]
MTTVELFCGIGGFRLAADTRRVRTLWANDICPKASSVYRGRFGTEQHRKADIRQVKDEIPQHDLLTGGFPCQPFSSAGKKKGIRDPRGTLFQEIIDVLASKQPAFFILENVKRLLTMERGFHFATILSSLADSNYQIEWRLLNAMDFGLPQNRQRVFIVGTHERRISTASALRIRLADSQDIPTDGGLLEAISEPAAWKPIERHGLRFPTWGMACTGRFIGADLSRFSAGLPRIRLRDVLEREVAREFDFTETTLKWIASNTPVNRLVQGVEILSNQSGGARMGYTIFGINGLAPTLTSTASRHYERYRIGDRYRRLTNIEYARIQGFPDDHCSTAPIYDQYALLGNAVPPPMAGWVVDRLTHGGIGPQDFPVEFRKLDLYSYADQRAVAHASSEESV